MAFRYSLTANDQVNCFFPRELTEATMNQTDKISSTQFGALYSQQGLSLDQVPTRVGAIIWEAEVRREVPYTLRPVKPKFWLLGRFALEDGLAYRVK